MEAKNKIMKADPHYFHRKDVVSQKETGKFQLFMSILKELNERTGRSLTWPIYNGSTKR